MTQPKAQAAVNKGQSPIGRLLYKHDTFHFRLVLDALYRLGWCGQRLPLP